MDDKLTQMLTLIDDFVRKCLVVRFDFRLTRDDVLDVLSVLLVSERLPDYIRLNNSSESAANALKDWLSMLEWRCPTLSLTVRVRMAITGVSMAGLRTSF